MVNWVRVVVIVVLVCITIGILFLGEDQGRHEDKLQAGTSLRPHARQGKAAQPSDSAEGADEPAASTIAADATAPAADLEGLVHERAEGLVGRSALPPAFLSAEIKPSCECNDGAATEVRYCTAVVRACGLSSHHPSSVVVSQLAATLAATGAKAAVCKASAAVTVPALAGLGSCAALKLKDAGVEPSASDASEEAPPAHPGMAVAAGAGARAGEALPERLPKVSLANFGFPKRAPRGTGAPLKPGERRLPVFVCSHFANCFTGAWLAPTALLLRYSTPPHASFKGLASVEASTQAIMGPESFQTRDTFDFFIEHLSYYEQYVEEATGVPPGSARYDAATAEIVRQAEAHATHIAAKPPPFTAAELADPEVQRLRDTTLAVVPFYGGHRGTPQAEAAHSALSTRYAYLDATVYAVRAYFPNVVVAVLCEDDREAVEARGLPLLEVMQVYEVAETPAKLANHALMHAQTRFKADWDRFKYCYFTEGDQLPHIRDFKTLMGTLDPGESDGEGLYLAPHRLDTLPLPRDFEDPETKAGLEHGLDVLGYGRAGVIDIRGPQIGADGEDFSCCWQGGDIAIDAYHGPCEKAADVGACEKELFRKEPTFTVDGGFPFQVQ